MKTFEVNTNESVSVMNITPQVEAQLPAHENGICLVFSPHSTVALAVGEDESDLMEDYVQVAEKLLKPTGPFKHCGHGVPNAEAHIFSALHGAYVLVPFEDGKLKLGTWQSVLLFELDGPRERHVWVITLA